MPLLKYTLLVGSSLLALLLAAEHVISPAPASGPNTSTSLQVLRKIANHGEVRGFAPLADSGAFLPIPVIVQPPVTAALELPKAETPKTVASESASPKPVVATIPAPPSVLDAQARIVATDVIDKPAKPARKVAAHKPKHPRSVYVENVAREPGGFFGGFQSW